MPHDAIGFSGRLLGEVLPTVRFAHWDLARGQQSPEQYRGSFRGRQHGLRLDPSLELFMQSLDRIRRADRFPLAFRKAREREQLVASLCRTIGDGLAL
jgi:hypothetical protein